jgi:hypothetical protein
LSAIAILVSAVFFVVAFTSPKNDPVRSANRHQAAPVTRSVALALVMFGLGFTAYVQISHLGAAWRTFSIAATGLASVFSSLIFFSAAYQAHFARRREPD